MTPGWISVLVAVSLTGLLGACVSQSGEVVAAGQPEAVAAALPAGPGGAPPVVADSAVATGSAAGQHRDAAAATASQTEPAVQEVVIESHSLSGFWKVTGPKFIDVSTGILSGVHIEYSADTADRDICLIDDRAGRLTGICSAGIAKPATGDRDGDHVVLHWWSGPATVIYSGNYDGSHTVRGNLSGGLVGLRVTGGVPIVLTKLEPDADDQGEPESARLVGAVLDDLHAGTLTPGRYGPEAIRHLQPELSHPHAGEGPAKITYLGRIHIRWQKKQAEKIQDVYKVRIAAGLELCRIALGDHGTVADFDCRALEI